MGTLPKSGSVSVEVDAAAEQVWSLLADVTRTGEWSHETNGAAWLDGATEAVPGARFAGTNRNGRFRWSRRCEMLTVDAPRVISWRTIATRRYPDSTIWTFEITPTATGCRVTQRYEVVKINPIADRLFYALIPAHRDRSAALLGDLRALGEAAKRARVNVS